VRSDNRIDNLRPATHAQNCWNGKSRRAGANLKGAYLHRSGYWRTQIMKNGKLYSFGPFSSAEEAHETYCKKAQELFGEFSRSK
jgi:hypothetical protein